MILTQLRYAGVFEAVTIRRSGYPFRMDLQRFMHWYRCLLLPRTSAGYTRGRTFKPAPWTTDDARGRVQQILQYTEQDFADVQVGKTLVLYRAREQRLLELLRSLALSNVVPCLQRVARGLLARECKRRCLKSAAALRQALKTVVSVAECDAAAAAHGKLIGGYAKIFAPKVKEIRELRKLRSACEQWVVLERELEGALAKYSIASEGDEEAEAFLRVEAALIHAEKLRGVIKCTPFQQKIYDHARKIVDANAAARLTPLGDRCMLEPNVAQKTTTLICMLPPRVSYVSSYVAPCTAAEEAVWLIDKVKMEYVSTEAKRVHYESDVVDEVRSMLALPEEKLVELQLKRAVELKDPKRVQNREIRSARQDCSGVTTARRDSA